MKRVYCFIVAFVVLVLVSCEPFPGPGNLAYGDVDDLYSVMTVTFIPAQVDEALDSFRIVDTDEYGRKLFIYYANQGALGPINRWAFIIQCSDETYSYFYEDQCCRALTAEQANKLKSEGAKYGEISELLAENDWQMPLDKSKCSRVKITNNPHNHPKEIYELFGFDIETMRYSSGRFRSLFGLCRDSDGNQLYMFVEYDGENYYAIQASIVNNDSIAAQTEINVENIFDEISAFKRANGFGIDKTYTSIGSDSYRKKWLD